MDVTLDEDKEIIEAQYRNRCAAVSELEERLIRADKAAVTARRVYDRLLREEGETRAEGARQAELESVSDDLPQQ
jgi:phenylpropionate dioxygenase-like ring-hydroxylating dioxygenase large terminal subunit